VAQAGIAFAIGLFMGYASLQAGPVAALGAALFLGLLLLRVRQRPELVGGYALGLGLMGVVLLGSIVLRMPACPQESATGECYAPVTSSTAAVYAVIGLAGAALAFRGIRRLRRA
jgi:hypothetical protein